MQSLEILHRREVITILSFMTRGLLENLFLCAILELVCAQAPYNMRRLCSAYMGLIFLCLCCISAGRWIGEFMYVVLIDNCFGLVEDTISIIQLYSLCAA